MRGEGTPVAEMKPILPQSVTQLQATSVALSMNQQGSVVLESAITKLPNGTKVELMTTSTQNMGVDTISLNNTTMGIITMSPVDRNADCGLIESNPGADDSKDETISPEQLESTEAISKAMSKEWAPLITNRDQLSARPIAYWGSKDRTLDE